MAFPSWCMRSMAGVLEARLPFIPTRRWKSQSTTTLSKRVPAYTGTACSSMEPLGWTGSPVSPSALSTYIRLLSTGKVTGIFIGCQLANASSTYIRLLSTAKVTGIFIGCQLANASSTYSRLLSTAKVTGILIGCQSVTSTYRRLQLAYSYASSQASYNQVTE